MTHVTNKPKVTVHKTRGGRAYHVQRRAVWWEVLLLGKEMEKVEITEEISGEYVLPSWCPAEYTGADNINAPVTIRISYGWHERCDGTVRYYGSPKYAVSGDLINIPLWIAWEFLRRLEKIDPTRDLYKFRLACRDLFLLLDEEFPNHPLAPNVNMDLRR